MPEVPDIADLQKALGSGTGQPRPAAAPSPPGTQVPDLDELWKQLGGRPQAPAKPPPDWGHALWEGIKRGGRDVFEGAAKIGAKMQAAAPEGAFIPEAAPMTAAAPDDPAARAALPGRVEAATAAGEKAYQASPAVQAHPLASGLGRVGGQMIGTAPLGVVPGAGQFPLAGRIGAAALQGGVGAGVLSGGDPRQAGVGAALGAVPGAVAGAIGPRIQPAFETIRQQFPHLTDMVTGRLGRTAKAFQEATANFALHPISAALDRGTKAGKDMLDQVGDKISAVYDAVLPRMTFRATAPHPGTNTTFVSGLPDLRAQLPSSRQADFDRLVADRITNKLDANGNMAGPEWKKADRMIGDRASRYERSSVADEQEYGSVLRELQENLRDTLALHNPAEAPALENANRAWSRYIQIQRAAGRRVADDEFTPSDLLYATRQSTGVRRFAQSANDMKAFGRAGDDLINGRPPNWRKYFPESIGGTALGTAGAVAGHRLAGPIGAMAGGGAGAVLGAGAGHLASRARQLPAARATGRVIERVGGPGAAAAADRLDPYVGPSGM